MSVFSRIHNMPIRTEMRLLKWGHIAQIIMVLAVIIFAFAKIGTHHVRGRSDVWGLSVGIKSLVSYTYTIGTESIPRWRRFYSIKAVAILNTIECVFWLVLIVISCMSAGRCSGVGCTLTGLTILLGFLLLFSAIPIAYVSIKHWRHHKRTGFHPYDEHHLNEGKTLPMSQITSSDGVYKR